MYFNKMVAVVKNGNKIFRENGDIVYMPFGSEYSLSFKNLHTTKAVVSVSIDGEDVLDNSELIVKPNQRVDLEGFLKGNNVTHKFKFIEKTEEISDFRGDRIDDGIILIKFKFEKKMSIFSNNVLIRKFTPNYSNFPDYCCNTVCCTDKLASCSTDDGITVHGSESNQSFTNGNIGLLEEEEHTIVFRLKGMTKNNCIEKPVYTKTKLQCSSCGRLWKSNNKFCSNCGTALI
jgi:hypothetical protein